MRCQRLSVPIALLLAAGGCRQAAPVVEEVTRTATEVAVHTGSMSRRQAQAVNRSVHAVAKTFEDITPEQEYYIGRAVAATILTQYRPWANVEANRYLNVVGQTLASVSDRPETFGGYHFLILDSDQINAFAAPGGFILLTKGMISLCRSEDALAAVLAHEIAHVEGKHGLRAIKQGRIAQALTIIATEAGKAYGSREVAQLTELFEGTVEDITDTLLNKGYSRELEREADRNAVKILARLGYNPRALISMLREMKKRYRPGGLGFSRTHPHPADRIADAGRLVARWPELQTEPHRAARFKTFLATL